MYSSSYILPFLEDYESPFWGSNNLNKMEYAKNISKTLSIDVLTGGERQAFKHDIYFCQDIAKTLINNPLLTKKEKKYVKRNIDKLMYIPSTLYLNYVSDHREKIYKNRDFTLLNTEELRKVIFCKHSSKVKDILERLDIIKIDRYYEAFHKSRGYRLNKKYWLSDWILKKRTALNIPCNISSKTHIHQRLDHSARKFTVNKSKAGHLMNEVIGDKGQECLDANRVLLQMVLDGELNTKVDPKTGRMFTAITNISKEMRACIELNGRSLIELDIKSSQPLLLTTLYPVGHPEREKYKNLVETGRFYEFMMTFLPGFNRNQIKKLTYTYFFGRTGNPNCRDYATAFSKEFPGMHEILINKKKDDVWGHKIVALELQTIEAAVVLGVCAMECLNKNIDLVSIHDSLMVLPEHKEAVIEIIVRNFQSVLGLVPQISQKEIEEVDYRPKNGENSIDYESGSV